MTMGRTSLNITDKRERWLERAKEKTGENTNAGAIDKALLHYLDTCREVDGLADDLEEEFQQEADKYAVGNFDLNVTVEVEEE
jgi:hypothetical protein